MREKEGGGERGSVCVRREGGRERRKVRGSDRGKEGDTKSERGKDKGIRWLGGSERKVERMVLRFK